MEYSDAIAYLEKLPSPENWTLDTARELSRRMKIKFNFEVLHVAGTNGKGSVCAYLTSILKNAGFKVGTYTSPHLEKYNERITINRKQISDAEFASMVGNGKPFVDEMKKNGNCPSEFEALTCMAFKYFDEGNLDFLVLETGLGGRLDATNIAPSRTQVITKISFDHMKNLGDSLEKIAFEKAGIVKQGSFVITTSKESGAFKEIERICQDKGAKLLALGRDFDFHIRKMDENGGKFDYLGIRDRKNLRISLVGEHQFENASAAITAIDSITLRNHKISESAIASGLLEARWKGRLEIFPKLDALIDGAHNPDGAESLGKSLENIFLKKYAGIVLVIGIMADKEYGKMIEIIAPFAKKIILTRAKTDRSAAPEKLLEECIRIGIAKKTIISGDVKSAIELAMKTRQSNELICISGSLYVAGEARKILLEMEKTK
ncbi:bifunctional folylpolyglutamate synthase/dihydrofolate synthase [Candidatus Micrarchaeota archaeon]|nr:bifunctional folylpolyglutamate synthase/dihydrofolate synthase [Candidatus Micrarchaeota archaeon]